MPASCGVPKKSRMRVLTENAKDFKNRLKQWIYTYRSLWIARRRDSTLFGVVDDTTTTTFSGRACAVHYNSLLVVVDKVVVVVLKFPNVTQTEWVLWSQFLRWLNKIYHKKNMFFKTFSAILKMFFPFNRIRYNIQRVTTCNWEDKEWCCVTANTILRIAKEWTETKNILKANCGMFTKTVIQNNGTCICERKDSHLIGNNAVK